GGSGDTWGRKTRTTWACGDLQPSLVVPVLLDFRALGRTARRRQVLKSRIRRDLFWSTPHWARTGNLRFRRPILYPIELGVRVLPQLSKKTPANKPARMSCRVPRGSPSSLRNAGGSSW